MPTFAHIIDGKLFAQQKVKQLEEQVALIQAKYQRSPKLVTILVGDDPASALYVDKKLRLCKKIGILDESIKLPSDIDEASLLNIIHKHNEDSNTTGILVQMPLPKHIESQKVIELISPNKDVDGFHPHNLGCLMQRKPRLRPCTPYGIMQLLQSLNIETEGENAVVVGVSNIVGRPMIAELLLAGATVTACHRLTRNLEDKIKTADIVVSATGVANIIKGHWIKPGSTVIDVGIIRLDNGKIVGDVEFNIAKERAAYITPVPGGVGPITVATLMQNTIEAFLLQQKNVD